MFFMKQTLYVLLCMCLLLTACAGGGEETLPSTTETTAATTASTTEATVETTAPTVHRHPLNGTVLDAPFTGRATAVVINNIQACLPQHGISNADIIFEVETEGGITRLLAVFSDLNAVEKLGPVRSSRTYFNSLSASLDAPIIHCGGSNLGINGYHSDNGEKISDWEHINEQHNGAYFYRDTDRRNSGYAMEHTLFTTGEKLLKGLSDKGFNKTYENGNDFGFLFDDAVTLDGDTAATVTASFNGNKTTTMTYDADSGVYKASQYNRNMIDGNTGDTMTFQNVLTLYTKQWKKYDGAYYRSYYTLIGSGEGHFACGGQIVPIKWSRESLREPFSFTLEDGTPLNLMTGTTYIGIMSPDHLVKYS